MPSDPGVVLVHDFQGLPRVCTRCGEHEEGLLLEKFDCPGSSSRTKTTPAVVQVQVTLLDGSFRFYPVPPEQGWKIDAGSRCLIVGKGFGRIYVPFDNIDSFTVLPIGSKE